MAVKDGLPATDLSAMNRKYVRDLRDGNTVPDGLPATDLSRMNREYIKAVVAEGGGGGGDITVEALSVTDNGTYTAPEGKAYSPVTVNVSGGAAVKVIAQGTITGSNGATIEINVGEEMATKNFFVDIYAQDASTFPYNSNYTIASWSYLHNAEFGAFAFSSTSGTYDNYECPGESYNVDNSGTITQVTIKPCAAFDTIRNGAGAQNGYNTPTIRKYSDKITIYWTRGNAQYIFPNTITYNFRVIYYGADWANESISIGE